MLDLLDVLLENIVDCFCNIIVMDFVNELLIGFSNPLTVCCGFGGPPYNFDLRVTFGQPGYQVCDEGSRYVNWDGTHHTEAANTFIASKILSTDYSTPRTPFDFFCHR